MVMSIPILDEAARLIEQNTLIDQLQILNVGEPVTAGATVTRSLTPVGEQVPGLVQSVTLENVVDGTVSQAYSIKVARFTSLRPGQAVRVVASRQEPSLTGQVLLVDTVSRNGAALLRKATGNIAKVVNTEGKEALA
ncbi:hypothetical protein SEA_LUNA18_11 [Microbacterium phage Luna18]|nr:hypothetical protein SEA_CHEPLI_11 [Microbacterium phage Chepli]QZE10299.1 hypothetical protein SEA_KATCHAN_11 [Microbacterium phage KatChan]URQ04862.1 hypothetical protein SEA_LUNA18_11 [Microbacterium phage Luna18]